VRDAVVLEAGAGEGYGADLLAGVARRVVALDYDRDAAAHVSAAYPGLDVLRGNLASLPLATGSVDVVANLQVIEHLWDQPQFVAECARVLRPGGTLLMTTPNRLTFSPGGVTLNPFHTRELAADELAELLESHFTVTAMLGLHHGARLRELDRRWGGLIDAQLATPPEAWNPELHADVVSVTTEDFELHAERVDASLDLVAVAVRNT
jgi:SAM-dependent methyltransferase